MDALWIIESILSIWRIDETHLAHAKMKITLFVVATKQQIHKSWRPEGRACVCVYVSVCWSRSRCLKEFSNLEMLNMCVCLSAHANCSWEKTEQQSERQQWEQDKYTLVITTYKNSSVQVCPAKNAAWLRLSGRTLLGILALHQVTHSSSSRGLLSTHKSNTPCAPPIICDIYLDGQAHCRGCGRSPGQNPGPGERGGGWDTNKISGRDDITPCAVFFSFDKWKP